jgi:AcrR family transcriptional regulator
MPLKTYYNLDQDKKERIFHAGLLEFTYREKNEASVNNIVRIANISKGSFYQYFKDKDDFYWFTIMRIFEGQLGIHSQLLKKYEGDIFLTEEAIFDAFLTLLDDQKIRMLITNVLLNDYLMLQSKLLQKGSTVYIDNYDLLTKFGFKGYSIRTKVDFLALYDILRNIQTNCISKLIMDNISKSDAKSTYQKQIDMLKKGILKRGIFN